MCRHWYKMIMSKSYRKHRWVGENYSSHRFSIRMACAFVACSPERLFLRDFALGQLTRSTFINKTIISRLTEILEIEFWKLVEYHDGRLDDTAGGA